MEDSRALAPVGASVAMLEHAIFELQASGCATQQSPLQASNATFNKQINPDSNNKERKLLHR